MKIISKEKPASNINHPRMSTCAIVQGQEVSAQVEELS